MCEVEVAERLLARIVASVALRVEPVGHEGNQRDAAPGQDAPHGTFSTNHDCTYDPRLENTIVVSDRANSWFEFFRYDHAGPDTFEWYKTCSLGKGTVPCKLRLYPELGGISPQTSPARSAC